MKDTVSVQEIVLQSTYPIRLSSLLPEDKPSQEAQDLRQEKLRLFLTEGEEGAKSLPPVFGRLSPYPLLASTGLVNELAALHTALSVAVTHIVERWWTDKEARFPEQMPLEEHEEAVLQWVDERSRQGKMKRFRQNQGYWRSDIVLDSLRGNTPRICEINARYSVNTQLKVGLGYAAYSSLGAGNGLVNAEKAMKSQFDLFDDALPIHILIDKYDCKFLDLFMASCKRRGVRFTPVTSASLRLVKDLQSHTGYRLCCVSEDGKSLDLIYQVGLLLYQHELASLPFDILCHVAMCSVNDLRSVFLVHDKRILGIVLAELDSLVVDHGVLSVEQAEILRRGVIPTVIPGSEEAERLYQERGSTKDEYIIKPIRDGRGKGILFGNDLSHEEWQSIMETMREGRPAPDQPQYVLQQVIQQPNIELLNDEGRLCHQHAVGSGLIADGVFVGPGMWKSSPGRISSMAHGGFGTVAMREEDNQDQKIHKPHDILPTLCRMDHGLPGSALIESR